MAKLTIRFVVDLDGDSEANIHPDDLRMLEQYGVMGLDWVVDMQADLLEVYALLHPGVFPDKWDAAVQ